MLLADFHFFEFAQGTQAEIQDSIGLDVSAFEDLQTHKCKAFNENPEVIEFEAECQATVTYQSYAGRQDFWGIFNLLKGPSRIIEEKEGELFLKTPLV